MEPPVTPARESLTALQLDIVQRGLLKKSSILSIPTGAGKTHLAHLNARTTQKRGFKTIYICPLKAIAQEVHQKWSTLNLKVGLYTGDTDFHDAPPADQDVLVLTVEKFEWITRFWREHWHWIPQVDLLIADEFHLLGDPKRGPTLESALHRFQRLNPFARVMALSATLGNLQELGAWLKAETYHSTTRPVPLTWKVVTFNSHNKLTLLQDTLRDPKPTLVFCSSRARATHLAQEIGGLAHHAGLTATQRSHAETAFRSGEVQVLCCTPTLEMGLNLPAQRVVLYDLERYDAGNFIPITVNSAWQRAGRAGRPGLHTEGEAVLFVYRHASDAEPYLQGKFEAIRSHLTGGALTTWIVSEIAARTSRDQHELTYAFQSTLRHQQQGGSVTQAVQTLQGCGALQTMPDGRLRVTRTGWIAARHMLSVETVLHLTRLQKANLTFLDLLTLACCTQDVQPAYVDRKHLQRLAQQVQNEPRTLITGNTTQDSQTLNVTPTALLMALHTAVQLRAYTRGQDTTLPESDIQQLTDQLHRVLRAYADLIDDNDPALISTRRKARVLSLMLQHQLNEENATLTLIHGIGGVLARRLMDLGVQHIEDLAQSNPEDLTAPGLTTTRTTLWVNEANAYVKTTRGAYFFQEASPAPVALMVSDFDEKAQYREWRSRELTVHPTDTRGVYEVAGLTHRTVDVRRPFTRQCGCPDDKRGHTCKHLLAVHRFLALTPTLEATP